MKDQAGFIVNALLFPYLNNAVRLFDAGVATRDDIDAAMKGGCNFPMGPLELLDLVGLDTSLAILEALYAEFKDPNYAPAPLLRRMVSAERLGRKTRRRLLRLQQEVRPEDCSRERARTLGCRAHAHRPQRARCRRRDRRVRTLVRRARGRRRVFVLQACALSVLMFTGGSQFALVSTMTNGGSGAAGAATAILLGSRNALYGLRLSSVLRVRGWRKAASAQLVIDESTAMAIAQDTDRAARLGFYATGLSVFVLWNLATLVGALAAQTLDDPSVFGLDAAAAAAFVALLAPRMRSRQTWIVAGGAMAVALVLTPFVPAGVPVLCAALVAVIVGWRGR